MSVSAIKIFESRVTRVMVNLEDLVMARGPYKSTYRVYVNAKQATSLFAEELVEGRYPYPVYITNGSVGVEDSVFYSAKDWLESDVEILSHPGPGVLFKRQIGLDEDSSASSDYQPSLLHRILTWGCW